ncbi:hypothetical protein D920_02615 [Enterococcus faecalis 13-SD-W-01]|nr:hypothetical protein D920_02615 [Enterococcus faecalis 13-SD-W-01]
MIAFFVGIGYCIVYAFKKRSVKKGLIFMGAGLMLFAAGGSLMPETSTSAEQSQTVATTSQKTEDTKEEAQKKKEAELKEQQEKERKEAEEKAQQEQEKKEVEEKAQQEKEKKDAEEKAQQLAEADGLVSQAESQKTRAAYDTAKVAVAGLPEANDGLNSRLSAVESAITQQEQAAAQQAEAERQAAQQAEAQRQAEAAQQAEAQRQAEQAAAQQAAPPSDQQTQVVYVAPQSGRRYHYDSSCRGLRTANQIQPMTLQQAIDQGYTLCGFED